MLNLKQTFVDQFSDSVYAKYIAYELSAVYQALGEDEKALQGFCKFSDEQFYYSEQIQSKIRTIGEKLYPLPLIPNLSEESPLPARSHPCSMPQKK